MRRVAREVRLVDLPHLGPDEVRGDEDASDPAGLQAAQEDVVVPGEHVEPVDRAEVVVVGLLDGHDVVDRRPRARQALGRHVDDRPRRDVVEDDGRRAGRLGDRLEVGAQAGRVRLVVVRGDDEHGVRAGVRGARA